MPQATPVRPTALSAPSDEQRVLERVEFRTVIEDAPVMLWLTDGDGRIVFTNTRWKDFVGSERYATHGDAVWVEALHPEDKKHVFDDFESAFKARLPFQMEYRLQRDDGEWRHVLDTGEPYHTAEGRFAGFIGSSTDITEHKRFEDELKRSHAELTRHNQEMGWINQLNSYLQACRRLDEIYPVIRHFAELIFPTFPGTLYLFNESKSLLESVVNWGEPSGQGELVLSPDDCWGLRQGKLHAVDETNPALGCRHVRSDVTRYVCVPVVAQGEMVGLLHLEGDCAGAYSGDDDSVDESRAGHQLVSVTADNLGLAIVSLKLREALEARSVRDPLTGLYNRRHMEDCLERELARARRTVEPLGVIMLDLDHFKQLNDEHGHDAGDAALAEAALIVTETLRSSDVACRYGGEEFLLILPNAPQAEVMKKAEALRAALAGRSFMCRGSSHRCPTASFGVAALEAGMADAADLIRCADRALYEAKRGGRDRVVAASS